MMVRLVSKRLILGSRIKSVPVLLRDTQLGWRGYIDIAKGPFFAVSIFVSTCDKKYCPSKVMNFYIL